MGFSDTGELFDLYVDWPRRLAREIPFLKEVLSSAGARRIADVACGTGRHAVALAREGFRVTGVDCDERFLDGGRRAGEEAGVTIDWVTASFDTLSQHFSGAGHLFDGVICLGNSISLVSPDAVEKTLGEMARLLGSGGILVVHTINYPMLAGRKGDPWGPVRELADGTLLLKGFVPRGEDPWDALFVALRRGEDGWTREPFRFSLFPHRREQIEKSARGAGLDVENVFGGFAGEKPDDTGAADLVYVFRNSGVRATP
jgi:ubiquinone/menaquinone biosynthesis C-methylase UbiE